MQPCLPRPRDAAAVFVFLVACLFAATPAGAVVATFQEGTSGYAGTQDTEIRSGDAGTSYGTATTISIDLVGSQGVQQGLIRFDNLFGNGAGQIPLGATITAATLRVDVTNASAGGAVISLHRMLVNWSEASTWNTMTNGLQFDGTDASATVDATVPDPTVTGAQTFSGANLTATVQAWSDGATNFGWGLETDNDQAWDFRSSEDGTAANRPLLSVTYSFQIAGTVFEDPNYGGGAGRTLAASSGSVRSNARVELFTGAGAYVTATTTDGSGNYQLAGLDPATYTVRVVNSTVTSSRTGYVAGLLPVQTYRTDASTGTAASVTDHVGGEVPGKADAGNGATTLAALTTGSTTAQSITTVTIATAHVTGVDFGYGFDVIVNTNNSGQGSLRQWLTNANALSNTGLAQSGRTAGIEHALWMLADGTARAGMNVGYASQFSGGVATVAPTSGLPAVTEAVVMDGTTQPGWSSTPIVELNGTGAGAATTGLTITSSGSTVSGLVIHDFTGAGIAVTGAATGNTITANSTHTNGGLGIDLANNGVTANDGAKTGGQPNQLMDQPVFTSAVLAGSTLTVTGYVGSAASQATFASSRVEVFESDNDGTGYGEGRTYLGYLTSSGSNGNFSGSLTAAGVSAGDKVTATATDGSGNTSEFAGNATVQLMAIVKRAYLADGTAVTSTTVVPKGTLVKFLLYLNNLGSAVNDASVQDVLAAGFQYVAGSMKTSNTVASCAGPNCTGAEESAIYAAANAGSAGTDAADGDAVSRSGATLNIGNQNAANAALNLAATKVWAVVFSVRAQ